MARKRDSLHIGEVCRREWTDLRWMDPYDVKGEDCDVAHIEANLAALHSNFPETKKCTIDSIMNFLTLARQPLAAHKTYSMHMINQPQQHPGYNLTYSCKNEMDSGPRRHNPSPPRQHACAATSRFQGEQGMQNTERYLHQPQANGHSTEGAGNSLRKILSLPAHGRIATEDTGPGSSSKKSASPDLNAMEGQRLGGGSTYFPPFAAPTALPTASNIASWTANEQLISGLVDELAWNRALLLQYSMQRAGVTVEPGLALALLHARASLGPSILHGTASPAFVNVAGSPAAASQAPVAPGQGPGHGGKSLLFCFVMDHGHFN